MGVRPGDGTLAAGEPYVNVKDKQYGVGDDSNNPMDLLAVRYHSSQASYIIGDIVAYDGGLWKATADHSGAFSESNWEGVSGSGGMSWESSSSGTVSATAGTGYLVYTNTETRTATLPVGSEGDTVGICDVSDNCSINNITVVSNGSENIMGLVENFLMDISGSTVIFTYSDASRGWVITGGNW